MIRFECGDRFKGTGDRFLKGDLLPFQMEKLIYGMLEEKMNCYSLLNLIIAALGVFATFFVGIRANKISKAIEDNNRNMEQIAKRPAPIIDKIYVKKSTNDEDYMNHMIFFYGDMNAEELSLENQVYVRTFNINLTDESTLISECIDNKQRVYFTYFRGNLCFIYNNIKSQRNFVFEYCSTKIELKNYKNIITSIKVNFLKVIDRNGQENRVDGIGKEKYIVITENGYIDIIMCFVANTPEETLCISDPEEYRKLPDKQSDVLKAVVNEPMLKYKTLIFNCTFKTIEGFSYTYDITINTTNVGFETWTQYINKQKEILNKRLFYMERAITKSALYYDEKHHFFGDRPDKGI